MRALRVVAEGPDAVTAVGEALAGGDAVMVGSPSPDLPDRVPQRVALVVETSGSTGRPKRVALSADAVLASAAASESALGAPGQWVLALPVRYVAGLNVVARSLAAGRAPVRTGPGPFTAAAFTAAARRLELPERYTSLVPAQLATLLEDREAVAELRAFSAVLVGGQALPGRLRDRAIAEGIRVVRTYGSTETCGGCVYDGVALSRVGVRVVDGEVWIGGPTLAEGYLGDDELTADRFPVLDGERWYRTSDAGEFDGERLAVTGRLDDVLISGGVKVSVGAVERVLHGVPGFEDAVVVAAPHPRWGESPVAFTTGAGDEADAIAAVEAALGPAARPRIVRVDALPLLPNGKPDRLAVRAMAAG